MHRYGQCFNSACPYHGHAAKRREERERLARDPFIRAVRQAAAKGKAKSTAVSHARKMLEAWERKRKLAETKIRIWQRKLGARERALTKFQEDTQS